MKKISAIIGILAALAISAAPAFAATITPGVQTTGGTITAWNISLNDGTFVRSYYGSIGVQINGTPVDSIHLNLYTEHNPNFSNSGLSLAYNAGDDVEFYNTDAGDATVNSGLSSITATLAAPPTCSPSTIANGTIGSYPGCAVSCGSGYVLSAGACVASGGGSSSSPIIYTNLMGITLATGTAAMFLANAASTVTDPGLLEVVALAVGIPLAFYILHQLIGLVPKGRTGRRS